MKVVVKGEMTSSKKNFRNVGDERVEVLIERLIRRIRKRLKK